MPSANIELNRAGSLHDVASPEYIDVGQLEHMEPVREVVRNELRTILEQLEKKPGATEDVSSSHVAYSTRDVVRHRIEQSQDITSS